jgi:vancomycin resistance protein YoaR
MKKGGSWVEKKNSDKGKGEQNRNPSLHSAFGNSANKEPRENKMTSGSQWENDDTLLFGRPERKGPQEKKPFVELGFGNLDQWNKKDPGELKKEPKKETSSKQGNELFFTQQPSTPQKKNPSEKAEPSGKATPPFSNVRPNWDQFSPSKSVQLGPPSTGLGSGLGPNQPASDGQTKANVPPSKSKPAPPSKPAKPTPPANQKTAAPKKKKVSIFSRQSKYFMMICMIAGLLITGIGVAYALQTFGLSNSGKFFGDLVKIQAGQDTIRLELKEVGYDGKNPTTVDKDKFLAWIETNIKPKVEKPVKNAQLKGNKLSAGIEKEQVGYQIDTEKVNAWLDDISDLTKDTKQIPLIILEPQWTEEDYQKVDQKSIGSAKRKLKSEEDFTKYTQSLDGWVVDPQETFSLHEALQASGLKTEGTRSLALALSSAATQAGLDSSIKKSNDFQFINNYNKPVMLKLNVEDGSIVVEILTTPESQPSTKQDNDDNNS